MSSLPLLFSYGHLQAMNQTHLYWSWENTHENVRPVMQDYLWIVQEHHGPRPSLFDEEEYQGLKELKDVKSESVEV